MVQSVLRTAECVVIKQGLNQGLNNYFFFFPTTFLCSFGCPGIQTRLASNSRKPPASSVGIKGYHHYLVSMHFLATVFLKPLTNMGTLMQGPFARL